MNDGFTITNCDRIEQKVFKITGSLTLTKISNGKETPANAVFTITGPNNYEKVIKYSELTNGSITLTGQATGIYTVTKSNASISGYTLTVTGETTTTVTTESTANITLTNTYVPDKLNEEDPKPTEHTSQKTAPSMGGSGPVQETN